MKVDVEVHEKRIQEFCRNIRHAILPNFLSVQMMWAKRHPKVIKGLLTLPHIRQTHMEQITIMMNM